MLPTCSPDTMEDKIHSSDISEETIDTGKQFPTNTEVGSAVTDVPMQFNAGVDLTESQVRCYIIIFYMLIILLLSNAYQNAV